MKIEFEVNVRRVLMPAGCGLVGLFALHAAYPQLFGFWPSTSQDLAAWVQAVGSVAAIVGAVWVANMQSRHKKEDDLLRAQLGAAGISVRLSRFAAELSNFSMISGFPYAESETPEIDELKAIQAWIGKPHYRPTQQEFAEIVPLPGKAAHRLARGYELLAVLQERLAPEGNLELLFLKSSQGARVAILNRLCDELQTASDMISVAAKECEKATHVGAPYPSYEERHGEERP